MSTFCKNMTFLKAVEAKALSLPFANDTDTQRFICNTKPMIAGLNVTRVSN